MHVRFQVERSVQKVLRKCREHVSGLGLLQMVGRGSVEGSAASSPGAQTMWLEILNCEHKNDAVWAFAF